MQAPALVIFDMDGLIFDSELAFMHTLQEVMAEYGLTMTREVYEETLGLSLADTRTVILRHYGPDAPFETIYREGRKRQNEKAARRGLPVKPGIRELLAWLKEQELPSCLASSSPRTTIEVYLRSAGLSGAFSFVISGDDIRNSKPDPEIFLRCCEHYGVRPAEAVVLEDSENGIRAAVAGGIPVICIPDMKQPAKGLAAQTAAMCPDAFAVRGLLAQSLS